MQTEMLSTPPGEHHQQGTVVARLLDLTFWSFKYGMHAHLVT